MEEEYLELFFASEDEENVLQIWEDNIRRNINLKFHLIEVYCKKNLFDYKQAFLFIYNRHKTYYEICFYDYENKKIAYDYRNIYGISMFLLRRIRENIDDKTLTSSERHQLYRKIYKYIDEKGEYNSKIGYELNNDQYFGDLDILFISQKPVLKELKELEKKINELSNEITKNNKTNESRETLKTELSKEELIRIFNELVEKKYISDDIDLFLSCFGFKEDKRGKIIWKSTKVEFEIFISEIIQKEENPVSKDMCLPRNKINCWFIDKYNKPIKSVPKTKISCGIDTYNTYKIVHKT